MSDDRKHIWEQAQQALSKSNARRFDGDDNFKKCLVIKTCVVGPGRGDPEGAYFAFDVKVPRSAVNDLFMSSSWSAETRAEAAAFLRELADLIEKTPEDEA